MKSRISTVLTLTAKTAAATAAALALLASCIRDNVDNANCITDGGGDRELVRGLPATLTLNPVLGDHETTRAYSDWGNDDFGDQPGDTDGATGRAADRKISTFRVLVYHAAGEENEGELVQSTGSGEYWNFFIDDPQKVDEVPYKFVIDTGKYDFVFIANEKRSGVAFYYNGTSKQVDFGTTGSKSDDFDNFSDLSALAVADTRHISPGIDIPMLAIHKNVVVRGGDDLTLGDGTLVQGTTWEVLMQRAAIRISLHLHLTKTQLTEWKRFHTGDTYPKIYITGLRDYSYLISRDNELFIPNTQEYFVEPWTSAMETDPAAQTQPGWYKVNPDGSADIFVDRLIEPELILILKTNSAKALEMSLHFDDGLVVTQKSALIFRTEPSDKSVPDPAWGYSVPRNTWLWVDGTAGPDRLDIVTQVLHWGDAVLDPTDLNQYNFTVSRELVVFDSAGGTQELEIFTDHPDGWELGAAVPEWITSGMPAGELAGQSRTLGLTALPNTGTVMMKEYLTIVAGNLTKKITVISLPATGSITSDDPAPTNVNLYVGAFWKANQYGERLINIHRPTTGSLAAIDGDWVATVAEGKDWIVLDTKSSTDTGVGTENPAMSGGDNGFDAAYRVNSVETSVGGKMSAGNPKIYFRIGLNGTIAAGAHRYGQVLLIYTNGGQTKFQRLWIRQGEADDYLMENSPARPYSMPFSPYNLTAETLDQAVDLYGTDPAVAVNPSRFADYPTQAGAYFQWGSDDPANNLRYAWNPYTPTVSGYTHYYIRPAWSVIGPENETCPAGYRRPNDGATDISGSLSTFDNSEYRQSLCRNVGTGSSFTPGNTQTGLYADGFFDRRFSAGKTYVSETNRDIAKGGWIFYNSATNASLFFSTVAGGEGRDASDGTLRYAYTPYYWSSTTGAMEFVSNGIMRNVSFVSSYAFPIRCVKDDPFEDIISEDARRITWKNGRYALTGDPTDAGLYFKFGSVVGLYSDNGGRLKTLTPADDGSNPYDEGFTLAALPWNLTGITETDEDGYEEIPSDEENDFESNIDDAYHTIANVREGMGDPCRLVGLNLDKIKNAERDSDLAVTDIDNGEWRLPTSQENRDFAGMQYNSWEDDEAYVRHFWYGGEFDLLRGIAGGEFPYMRSNSGHFLPAAGFRDEEGYFKGHGTLGHYWSSEAAQELGFGSNFLYPFDTYDTPIAYTVRCVRQ